MNFYNIDQAKKLNIDYPDIYFTPEYGEACEYSDNAEWELCQYKDLIYVYLKRPYEFQNKIYYDLITPYGYSGYYYKNKETYQEFLPLFREEAKKRNYLTEVLRQNPYININIEDYDIICKKEIFSVKINNFEDYFKNSLKSNTRNKINKGIKLNYSYNFENLKEGKLINDFKSIYNFTMNKVNSIKYYYFNDNYYSSLEKFSNSYLMKIYNEKKEVIGVSIFLVYKDFIHYHLSGNNSSSNCITDYYLNNVIKNLGLGKEVILGGGLYDNDSLSKFKKKISTNKYNYIIYKNIINQEVYDELNKNKEETFFPLHLKN